MMLAGRWAAHVGCVQLGANGGEPIAQNRQQCTPLSARPCSLPPRFGLQNTPIGFSFTNLLCDSSAKRLLPWGVNRRLTVGLGLLGKRFVTTA